MCRAHAGQTFPRQMCDPKPSPSVKSVHKGWANGGTCVFARAERERSPGQVMVAVDFQKAYNSVPFAMLRVALLYLRLPMAYVNILMSVLAGPILFWVGQGGVADAKFDKAEPQLYGCLGCHSFS